MKLSFSEFANSLLWHLKDIFPFNFWQYRIGFHVSVQELVPVPPWPKAPTITVDRYAGSQYSCYGIHRVPTIIRFFSLAALCTQWNLTIIQTKFERPRILMREICKNFRHSKSGIRKFGNVLPNYCRCKTHWPPENMYFLIDR